MNFDLVPRRYRVTDEQIDDGDFQAIVTPLWWEVSIYDGETEMYDSLDRFTDPQNMSGLFSGIIPKWKTAVTTSFSITIPESSGNLRSKDSA